MEYKVKVVNFPRQYFRIKNEIDNTIKEILETGRFILREDVENFERNIASFLGTKYAIGLNSGTDAIFLSYCTAGIKPGDEVITVSHTFVSTVATVIHCGAKPVLVDIGEDMNMDTEKLEDVITEKTKAIVPVHLNGRVCNMEKIMKIAKENNLIVIEDAAQSLGAHFNGQNAGSFGLTSCFSFYPAKILGTIGDGGLVATNDEEITNKIRLLRNHGQNRNTGEIIGFGFNSRLDNLHAAILNVKLKHVPSYIKRRREIAKMYNEELENLGDIIIPPKPDKVFSDVYQSYVIRTKKRNDLATFLKGNGIETLINWSVPVHKHKALKLEHFKLPKTEEISAQILSLPMYSELEDDEVNYIIKTIKKFYKIQN